MNVRASYQELRDLLATKAHELFEAYGVPCIDGVAPPSDDVALCGVLGFAGDRWCGSIVVAASGGALSSSNPVSNEASRGWGAELTNQLVGRFKNELLRRGVEVSISIPIVLTATNLVPKEPFSSRPIHLVVGSGAATIWLEVEGEVLLAASCVDPTVALEGDFLMF